MKVTLVGYTTFEYPAHVPYTPDPTMYETAGTKTDGQHLVEFAGRACYQSWSKPNAATATNADYLRHIIDVGHLSVLEHASATFYVEGVSRSLTHELVRHRHLSFSQLSQRFVNEDRWGAPEDGYVVPPLLREIMGTEVDDNDRVIIRQHLANADADARTRYTDLVMLLMDRGVTRKRAREAARCVLPNMTETKIVVTGNYRAWRHFIDLRASLAADAEIRLLALEVLRRLRGVAPNVFGDYVLDQLDDVDYARPGRAGHVDG